MFFSQIIENLKLNKSIEGMVDGIIRQIEIKIKRSYESNCTDWLNATKTNTNCLIDKTFNQFNNNDNLQDMVFQTLKHMTMNARI